MTAVIAAVTTTATMAVQTVTNLERVWNPGGHGQLLTLATTDPFPYSVTRRSDTDGRRRKSVVRG